MAPPGLWSLGFRFLNELGTGLSLAPSLEISGVGYDEARFWNLSVDVSGQLRI